LYKEMATEEEILALLEPLFKHYSEERKKGERFGDFVVRMGVVDAAKELSVIR